MTGGRFDKSGFQVIGTVLFFSLIGWVVYYLGAVPFQLNIPEPGGPAARATESDMPVKEFETAVSRAKDVMGSWYRTSNWFRWGSQLCDWVGFGLTSAITVIVGATGRVLQPGQDPAALVDAGEVKLQRKWMRRVGVIAALASIMIGVASRLQSESQSALENGEKLRTVIATARKEFNDATTRTEAQNIVDGLQSTVEKL